MSPVGEQLPQGGAREIEQGTLGRTALTLEARVRNAWYDIVLARAIDHVQRAIELEA